MNNSINYKGTLLKTYKVTYISGLVGFPKIKRGLLMQLYADGFAFWGRSFPFVWIPYNSVINFNMVVGYGSKMDYRPSDMALAKVIELRYINRGQENSLVKFELASTLNVFNDHQTRMELIPFLKANGIYDKFISGK